jgi:hypothetical protein
MFSPSRRGFVLGSFGALALHACGGSREDGVVRCAQCGMRVDTAPAWLAGHGEARFDGPKCLFRWAAAQGADAGSGFGTEYYDGERVELRGAFFGVDSDVLSPMGDDLVPLRTREVAERFARDHGGRVVTFAEVDEALLASLR